MDRDTIVGLALSAGLFIAYISYSQRQHKREEQQKQQIVVASREKNPSRFDNRANQPEYFFKHNVLANKFTTPTSSKKRTLENKDIKVVFDTNGGRIHQVFLKNKVDYKENPVQLVSENTRTGFKFKFFHSVISTDHLIFEIDEKNSDDKKISFFCDLGDDRIIRQVYGLNDEGFVVDHRWHFENSNKYNEREIIHFFWEGSFLRQELDRDYCAKRTTINYLTADDKFDGFNEVTTKEQKEIFSNLKWVALQQRFFTIGIDGFGSFSNVHCALRPSFDPNRLKDVDISANVVDHRNKSHSGTQGGIRYYFGPNDYKSLKNFADQFDRNLYLGFPVARQINEYLFLPITNFLHQYVNNVIWLIFVLVIVMKLLILPLGWKSYVSMIQMSILNPMLTELQARYKDKPDVFQLEQMKLLKELGVSPLGGCIPMLLQWPIFIAMFTLIPNIDIFRHQSFLWVKDWSSYDSICSLPFSIPLYGNHVSLFAILMTVSSVLSSVFSSKSVPQDPQQSQAQMKFLHYFLPITFLLIMNNLPAALTFYYFLSNLFQILQQYIVRKFVDEESLRNKMEERRKRSSHGPSFNKKIQEIIDLQKNN